MTLEEAERLRKEMRELRQQAASSARSSVAQKDRNNRLAKEAKTLGQKIRDFAEENEKLKKEVEDLKLQLAKTEEHRDKLAGMIFKKNKKLDADSSVSSGEPPEKRRLGGQPGHKGHSRKSPPHINEEKRVYLTHCLDCRHKLKRTSIVTKRIVEDIPAPISSIITLYRIERQWCAHCKKEVQAQPCNTLPGVRFGNNIVQIIAFLKYRLRTPLAKIKECLWEMCHVKISEGGITELLHNLGKRFEEAYTKLVNKVRNSKVKHADETGWRINGQNSWAWLFATNKTAVYTIEESRGKGVVDRFLSTKPTGVLVSDDYGAYQKLPLARQSCWAHLLRVGREAVKHPKASEDMKELYAELTALFTVLDHAVKTSLKSQERELAKAEGQKTISAILTRTYTERDVLAVQTRIRRQDHRLLTALHYEGVALTNNHAERQIRPLTVTRKISGGSRSKQGARTHAVLMSIVQTASLQKKPIFKELSKLFSLPGQQFVLEKGE